MSLIDCGCGPGTITLGLAEIVAPGEVVGVDINAQRIAEARTLATAEGADQVRFEVASVIELLAPSQAFDAAFENRCFEHLVDAGPAVREVFRVLKPGGVFGAGERFVNSDVWGNLGPTLRRAMQLSVRASNRAIWGKTDGGLGIDRRFAERFSSLLIRTGFVDLGMTAFWESYGTRERVAWMGEYMARQRGAEVARIIKSGWADQAEMDRISDAWREWGQRPGSYCAIARVGFVAHKPL